MKIFLLGFMGSGKTSVGKKVARLLGIGFIDLDILVETQSKMSINEIFESQGEDEFRIQEKEALLTLTQSDIVVATGGGTPCYHGNMEHMNANGTTIYLQLNTQSLRNRLKESTQKRPLIKNLDDKELLHYIEVKLKEREPYYQQANHIIEAGHITNAAEKIMKLTGEK